MRKFVQCGKYFRSQAVPPYTSFTVYVNFLPKRENLSFFRKYKSVTFNDDVIAYVTNLQDHILSPEACVAVVYNLV
jgi:hypothetical protein